MLESSAETQPEMFSALDIRPEPLPDLVEKSGPNPLKVQPLPAPVPSKRKWGRPRENPVAAPDASGLCGLVCEPVNWAESWEAPSEQAYTSILAESVIEPLEVVNLEYALISNEYTQRDEWWLLSPDNPESSRWIEAKDLEQAEVLAHETYKVLDEGQPLPPGNKPLPAMPIYCKKRDGRYKCRAVIGGHLQHSTLPNYAPAISIPAVRLMITETISKGTGITLADLQDALLSAELSSEDGTIAIKLPKSWQKTSQPYAILKKAMYGLKVAPRRWRDKVHKALGTEHGWFAVGENGLYKKQVDGTDIWPTLYVDDIIVGGSSDEVRESELSKIFSISPGKVLPPAIAQQDDVKIKTYDTNGIALEINETSMSYHVHMQVYINKLLSKYNTQDAAPVSHPKVNTELMLKQPAPPELPSPRMPRRTNLAVYDGPTGHHL